MCNIVQSPAGIVAQGVALSWISPVIPSPNLLPPNVKVIRDSSVTFNILPGDRTFIDSSAQCGQNYCYAIKSEYEALKVADTLKRPAQITYSNIACAQAQGNLNPSPLTLFGVTNDTANFNVAFWSAPKSKVKGYTVNRYDAGGTVFQHSNETNNFEFTIPFSNALNRFCYSVGYTDSCGHFSKATPTACPVHITSAELKPGFIRVLRTDYTGPLPAGKITYELQYLDDKNEILETKSFGDNYDYNEDGRVLLSQKLRYRLRVLVNGADPLRMPLYSNISEIMQSVRLTYPDAFSPNNDGLNDTFKIYSVFLKTFEVRVFNRWGQMVYFSNDPNQEWNGQFNNSPVPEDVYVCVIKSADEQGNKTEQRGTLMVIR